MRCVGIDYSICSPAIALIADSPDVVLVHYMSTTKRLQTNFVLKSQTTELRLIGTPYPDHQSSEERHEKLAAWTSGMIPDDSTVRIEDYAMGAKGRVFHIGECCGLMKHRLWSRHIPFSLTAPTAIKKWATGKGNADKIEMHGAFFARTNIDLKSALLPNSTGVGNPVSDIVDAYYLAVYEWTVRRDGNASITKSRSTP